MKYTRFLNILILILMLPALAAAPGCIKVRMADQTQNNELVTDAYVARAVDRELKPVNATNTFYVDADIIYLSLKINNAPSNTQVLVKMTYIEGENTQLNNTSMFNQTQSGEGTMYMAFAIKPPPGGFSQGDYRVDISANGKEQISVPFKVQNLSAQKGAPIINKFSANVNTVPLGQSFTLTWDISNATYITLQPEIGTIPAVGTRSITPTMTTKYIITASNDVAATKGELTINVGPAVTGATDLIITAVWLQGDMVYYTIKNAGTADSKPCYSQIYVDKLKPTLGYASFVDVLKPGQEKTLLFSSYQWPYSNLGMGNPAEWAPGTYIYFDPMIFNHSIKICADAKAEVAESNENNNCYYKLYGPLWNYDLTAVSHEATYTNSWDKLDDMQGMVETDPHGAHIKLSGGGFEMVPEQKPQGILRGKFGFYYQDYLGAPIETYPIMVPPKLKFISRVGLDSSATGSDGVTFKLGFLDSTDTLRWLDSKKMTTPGKFEDWTVDLSDQEGTFGYFLLQVDAGTTPDKDYAVWKEARLQQVSD